MNNPVINQKPVLLWLYSCCAMIFIMVIIGGLTRLTDSGLSMVEWRPLLGILPPLSSDEWGRLFTLYQETPEYRIINAGMTLLEFKTIFWLEYFHRLWGRLIGVVFLVPMVVFWFKNMLQNRQKWHLTVILALGSGQGLLGWYMVQSGLVERPDVSHYRLGAHLSLAVFIYAYVFLLARSIHLTGSINLNSVHHHGVQLDDSHFDEGGFDEGGFKDIEGRLWMVIILALIGVTILYGGFVAGLDAGLAYNQFPLMGEALLPPDALILRPWFVNLWANVGMVQFVHRWLAIATVITILAFWARLFWVYQRYQFQDHQLRTPILRKATNALAIVAIAQASLGIATLLFYVPLPVALIHQSGAIILLTAALWVAGYMFTSHPGTSLNFSLQDPSLGPKVSTLQAKSILNRANH